MEKPTTSGRPTQLAQLVRAGVLSSGTKLFAEYKGHTYTAVIDAERIRLASGEVFRKPDEAADRVRDDNAKKGMAFWHVDHVDGRRASLQAVFAQAKADGRFVK
jgi:hypothetical protein